MSTTANPKPETAPAPFIVNGLRVLHDGKMIAQAESGTMARRIANALKNYKPGPRGY